MNYFNCPHKNVLLKHLTCPELIVCQKDILQPSKSLNWTSNLTENFFSLLISCFLPLFLPNCECQAPLSKIIYLGFFSPYYKSNICSLQKTEKKNKFKKKKKIQLPLDSLPRERLLRLQQISFPVVFYHGLFYIVNKNIYSIVQPELSTLYLKLNISICHSKSFRTFLETAEYFYQQSA